MKRDMEKYRAYQRNYQKSYRAKRYAKMLEFLGGKCVICGTSEHLEIHHKDPREKEFDPGSRTRKWVDTLAELSKCELRCETHHRQVHTELRVVHGTSQMYRRFRCRCYECVSEYREWKRAADQRYREKNYEKIRSQQIAYYQKNRETIRQKQNEKRREQSNASL